MSHSCYMAGTRLRTAHGDVAVDLLRAGDAIGVRRDGKEVLETVKWVGYAAVDLARHAHVEDAAPIHFRPHAIDENQPCRNLFLSPEHCLVIDGLCIPAKLLVNGGSIVSERDHAPFIYYHIELDRHGVLLAENTPAESYLDTGNRAMFDNAGQPQQLHPTFTSNHDAARWLTEACAPLAKVPEQVEPIWRRLARRSQQLDYAIPAIRTTAEAGLHVVADGHAIRPISGHLTHYVFLIPASVASVSLVSRFCIPADKMISGERDTRRLGVRVNWISIRYGNHEAVLPADHPALQAGWNAVERDHAAIWRWTDGAATIPWETITEAAVLTVRCTPINQYPLYDAKLRLVA